MAIQLAWVVGAFVMVAMMLNRLGWFSAIPLLSTGSAIEAFAGPDEDEQMPETDRAPARPFARPEVLMASVAALGAARLAAYVTLGA